LSRAAVTVSFDNLGEVTELARGEWPADEPLGRHSSVTRALPRILELLDELELRATFFVEGRNAELYPDTLVALDAAGHEVAYHGWCHEQWADLDPAEEAEVLRRGVAALRRLGLLACGFRPPGGRLTDGSAAALRAWGFAYCSPADEEVVKGIASVPFAWPLVDAYYYLPRFGALRARDLGADDVLPPSRFAAAVAAALRAVVERGCHVSLVFHPFLIEPSERFDVLAQALRTVRGLVDDGAVRCAPYRELIG
jgi:peptidoglycan/xylan/chitin deacetylase (PgdA/CDA1 family)